ncbi:MAG: RNA polymerase sigma factor region1.1 domain-containing protein, partial [Gaiellales bacterium]
MATDALTQPQIAALLDRGEESSCLELSEVDELIQSLELEDEAVEALYEEIQRRGIEVRDDCGRAVPESTY